MARVKKLVSTALVLIIFTSIIGIIPNVTIASTQTPGQSNNTQWRDVDVSLDEIPEIPITESQKTITVNDLTNAVGNIVTFPVTGAINASLVAVQKVMLTFVNTAIVWGAQAVNYILTNGNDIGNSRTNQGLVDIWVKVRNLSLTLLTLGLIIIAFANVLNIDTEKYGLQRMIPKMIFAIFMAYFSFFLARLILELCSALQMGLIGFNGQSDIFNANFIKLMSVKDNSVFDIIFKNTGELLAKGLFTILLLLGVVFAMLWLVIILIVRTAMIWILVAIAPLAFILYIMPFTESYYSQWWGQFFKWAFMGPVVALLLWITTQLVGSYATMANTSDITNGNSWFILIMIAVGIYLAATIPLQMGGDPMKMISGLMKNYGKKGLKMGVERAGLTDAWNTIKTEGKRKSARKGLGLIGKAVDINPQLARMAGITPQLEKRAGEVLISDLSENHWKPLGQGGMEAAKNTYFEENGELKPGADKAMAASLAHAILVGKFGDKSKPQDRGMMATAAAFSTTVEDEIKAQPEWISALNNNINDGKPDEIGGTALWDGVDKDDKSTAAGRLKGYWDNVQSKKPLSEQGSHSIRLLENTNPQRLMAKLDPESVAAALRSTGFDQGAREALVKAADKLESLSGTLGHIHPDSKRMIDELRRGGGATPPPASGGTPPRGSGQGPNSQI